MSKIVDKVLAEHGEDWLVAAIIYGSIGYSGVKSAGILIDDYKRGMKACYSERCMCCYGCNLIAMLERDIESFSRSCKIEPGLEQRYISYVKTTRNLDPVEQASLGLFLPTTG